MADIDLSGLTPRDPDPDDTVVVVQQGSPDVMALVSIDAITKLRGYTTTATTGGTTTLTAASTDLQRFTGTFSDTLVLPDVTTLTLGRTFRIVNESTGSINIQSSGLNNIGSTVQEGQSAMVTCILLTGTDAASWLLRIEGGRQRTGNGAALVFGNSPTFTGVPVFPAGFSGGASLRVPHGSAPSSPTDGDVWTTTAGVFARINGATVGPFGGGTPGGSTNQIQFNDGAGGFDGAANVEISSDNLKLVTTTDPSAPTGGLLLYAFSMAGRLLPKMVGPSGIDTALQAALHGNSVVLISPTSGTAAPNIVGGTLSTAATMSLQFTAGSSNRWSSTQRKRFQTSTTAGNASGMRTAYTQWFRGNAAGFGGFFFRAQFGAQINLNGGQKFIGLCASTGALAGDPSALLNMCGMGYDAGDSSAGNWQFMLNDGSGSATKVDLGSDAARGTTQGWDLTMFLAPNSAELFVRITNLNTGVVVLDTSYTTGLPAVNTGMAFKAEVRNGAVAAADNLEVAKVYIETDY